MGLFSTWLRLLGDGQRMMAAVVSRFIHRRRYTKGQYIHYDSWFLLYLYMRGESTPCRSD